VGRNSFLIALSLLVCFIAAMSGCVISPRRIVGGGGSPTPTPSGSPSPGSTGKLYVTNQSANSILRFDNALTANGDQPPAATISGGTTKLNAPQFLALDTNADRLFVANANGSSVLVFDLISTKTGNITPTRSIGGPVNSLIITPSDVALDRGRDLLYVADGAEVLVFSPASTVNGDVPPVRDITAIFNNAQINIQGIFLDAANDRLYVTDLNGNGIDIFDSASTLNGLTVASRNISGANTKLAQPSSLTLDASGNLVVSNQGNGSITVYSSAATASGNISPIAAISGTTTTLLAPAQIVRNPAGSANEVYVADPTADEVAVFSGISTQNGSPPPVRKIVGTATTLTGVSARGVALDTTR
jgi:6-phosphogluconolactonase (cycloisomerase 2 family)